MNGTYTAKLIEQLKKINHYGYESEDYELSHRQMLKQAYEKCVNFTAIFHIIMGAFLSLLLLGLIRPEMLTEYVSFFVLATVLRFYYYHKHNVTPEFQALVCRFSITMLLFFGIVESLSDKNVVATAILALFIVTATVFTDSVIIYSLICLLNVIVLIVTSFAIKAPYLANGDLVNGITFAVVAVAIHYVAQRERIEYYVTSAQLQKLREEQLQNELSVVQASNEAKTLFLSKMSHEIRTPINAILGLNEMIMREYDDPTLNEYTNNIKSSGQTLLTIVNDILDFSKIEAQKMEIIPVKYELSTLINDVVNMISARADKKSLELKFVVSPDIPNYLYGDDIRIKQCILNILTNAVKYTDTGSVTLEVTSRRSSTGTVYVGFRSIDTGIGINKEDLEKLFSPFERIEEIRNRSIEGTGLGMNIVKHLLALMDTKLQVHSVYGEGSDFFFEVEQTIIKDVPIGDFSKTYKKNLSKRSIEHTGFMAPEARILVIDDNALNLTVITGLLKETRLMVDTAGSGFEGLKKVCETDYDCIFIDHLMPNMDGIETLKKMRENSSNKNLSVPYIALTANAINGAREEYLSHGFDDYLSKPIDIKLLEKLLLKYLPKDKLLLPGDPEFQKALTVPKKPEGNKDETVVTGETKQENQICSLNKLQGLDLMAALNNTGSSELLRTVIMEYREHIQENADRIEAYYEQEHWEDFTIAVHALKSTSRVIGAVRLSELCQQLETAGKDNDRDTIRYLTPSMLKLYRSYIEKLRFPEDSQKKEETSEKEVPDNQAGEKPASSQKAEPQNKTSDLKDVLSRVKRSLEDYDYDSSEAALKELDDSELSGDVKESLDRIWDAIRNLDAEIGIEIIDSMKSVI